MSRYLYGIHPAEEALDATPGEVERVMFAQGPLKGPLQRLNDSARKAGIRVEYVSRDTLARLADGGVHQGVVLKMAEFSYADLEDAVEAFQAAGPGGLVLVLDGIEDPHNLGALIRSAHALGAQAVVIPKDRAVGVTGVVSKASAGAIAHLPVARVTNIGRALERLKEAGGWVSAADMNGERVPEQVDFKGPAVLVIGSEGEGVRKSVLENADFRVRIPMVGQFGSLNASVAGAVLLYEVSRQRRAAPVAREKGA